MTGIRVLHVALSEDFTETRAHLERRGYEVTVDAVADPQSALDYLTSEAVDCVVFRDDLVDDVVAFVERLRETDPDTPAILVTDDGPVETALSAGVTECVRTTGDTDHHVLLAKRIGDTVERVRIEGERDESRRFVDQLFEHVPVSLYVKDEGARHVRHSGFYGADPEKVEGKTDRELYPYLGEETYRDDMRVLRTGDPTINRIEHLPKDDEWNVTSKAPWYGDGGEIKGLIGVTRRITEQKEYERELERQNERLNEFARIVSHELRNPLQVARGRTELLRDRPDDDHVDEVVGALDRMDDLITSLHGLATGSMQGEQVADVSLGDVVEKCWTVVDPDDATLVTEGDATIRADRTRLEHLLENLFENSVEHGSTSPDSQTRRDAVEDVTVTVGITDDGFYVADDGPGIPESDREDVFEVGYSTGGQRAGYGLRIVAEVAATQGWDVQVSSSAGGGARFDVTDVEFVE